MTEFKTVPNQRVITVNKEPTDKQNIYTKNNLAALDEAAGKLKSLGGFKLYMYFAKNQDNYKFALSSADFCKWSGVKIGAYNTAFAELVENGYLISENNNNIYTFYEKAQPVAKEKKG